MGAKIQKSFLFTAILILLAAAADGRDRSLEQRALDAQYRVANAADCGESRSYRVYLIDNFDQQVDIIPEIHTSHGELVQAMIVSGRNEISVQRLNTSLVRGLAHVILEVAGGEGCVDGIVSAIPGSNYSYGQVATFLDETTALNKENILKYKERLRRRMLEIAYHGFPSLEWLMKVDANPVKLRDDAWKIAFIEILGKAGIPVYLPYGNRDGRYRGEYRQVNLLGLARGVHIYGGLDAEGRKIEGFPYSPLSTGEGISSFSLMECPDSSDGLLAHLDINEDGITDFSYSRGDFIAYYGEKGELRYAPSPLSRKLFRAMLYNNDLGKTLIRREGGIVLSTEQYRRIRGAGYGLPPLKEPVKQLVWINSGIHKKVFAFNPQCRRRGRLSGSSFVPPLKVKEALFGYANGVRDNRRPEGVVMPLSEFELRKIRKLVASYCEKKSQAADRSNCEVTYRVFENEVWMFERRPCLDNPGELSEFAFAMASCDLETRLWTLFRQDEENNWCMAAGSSPTRSFERLIEHIEDGESARWN